MSSILSLKLICHFTAFFIGRILNDVGRSRKFDESDWTSLGCFISNEEDRREVLGRAGSLVADRKSNIQITEDMSRQDRQGWCELQRFMLRVMDRYPNSKVRLARERLTVDSRVFVWDRLSGKVEEQRVVTIPIQGDIVSSTNGSATRYWG